MLAQIGMAEHARKKVGELSRGMGQLIQFAATVLHQPQIVVLDEPFSGLDPVNVRHMKTMVGELRDQGVAIMFSTHQMTDVEELSDRVVMMDQGRVVLEGKLAEVKRRFRSDLLTVECDGWPEGIQGVTDVQHKGDTHTMRLLPDATPEAVLRQLLEQGVSIGRFELAMPTMEEIFLATVGGHGA